MIIITTSKKNFIWKFVYISNISDINILRNGLAADCVQFAMYATATDQHYCSQLVFPITTTVLFSVR